MSTDTESSESSAPSESATPSESAEASRPLRRHRPKIIPPRLMDSGGTVKEFGPGTLVAIYIRVSMTEQIEGFSLSAQERACRAFAEQRQWEVTIIYEDPGHSGKNEKRPGFQSMLLGARAHQFRIVLVHKLDRFARSIDTTLKVFRELNSCDVTLASVTEDFDYTTPMGRMVFHMMAVFAQWYLENLSAETVKGKHERSIKGLHNGRVSFGYIKVLGTKIAQLEPLAAAAVRKAFEMYRSGQYTDRQIAEYLNEQGFLTYNKHKWSKDTVRVMLQNEFYYGMVSYRNELLPGQQTPLITKEEYDEAQAIRAKRAHRPKSYTSTPKRYYLLQRLAHCEKCERPLRMQGASEHYYYKDASRERGLECPHANQSIRMELADEQVLALLGGLRLPDDWQNEIEARLRTTDEAGQIEKRRTQLRENIRRLGRAYTSGGMDDDEYAGKLAKAQEELAGLVVPNTGHLLEVGLQIETLAEYLAEATVGERAELCQLLLEAVYIDLEQGRVVRLKPNAPLQVLFALVAETMGWKTDGQGGLRLPKPPKEHVAK